MNKYEIKKLINGKAGTRVYMPLVPESLAFRRAYLAEMRRVIKEVTKFVREVIIPSYKSELLLDAREDNFRDLKRLTNGLMLSTDKTIKNLLHLESIKHTERFTESARKAFSVDLGSIVKEEDLSSYLDRAALRNAGLVTGMTDDLTKKIQTITTNSLIKGETVKDLRAKLKKELGISDKRAQLIATDQTSKLNSDLNRIRHEQAGVNSYAWRTSRDERVRARHKKLDGVVYEYGEKTGAEEGLSPGQPIRCRCNAQGVVDFGEDVKTPKTPVKPKPPLELKKVSTKVQIPKKPKNLSEVEKLIVENGIAEKSSFVKNLPVTGLMQFVNGIVFAQSRFKGADKLQAVASASKVGVRNKGLAFYLPGRNTIVLNPKALKKLNEPSERQLKEYKLSQEAAMRTASPEVKAIHKKLRKPFTWSSTKMNANSTATHEFGHHFHQTYKKEIDDIVGHYSFNSERWPWLVSKYGLTNRSEYVAESFALYLLEPEEHDRIYPPLLKFFKEKDSLIDG